MAEDTKWTAEMEVALFQAMRDHKPVGISKHWHMICIHQQMVSHGNPSITVKDIWKHLRGLYDLDVIDDMETGLGLPLQESEFELPQPVAPEEPDVTSTNVRKRGRSSPSPSPLLSPHHSTKRKKTQQL